MDDSIFYDAVRSSGGYTLRLKVNERTHMQVMECANHHTNGNISALLRGLVAYGLVCLDEREDTEPSIEMQAMHTEAALEKRQKVQERLYHAANMLREKDLPGAAQTMENLAKKYGLEWPPDKAAYSASHTQKVWNCIERLWDKTDSDEITRRELQRGLSSTLSSKHIHSCLTKLEGDGRIVLMERDHGTIIITRPPLAA